MNWMQVEARVAQDDRCVLPLGCTEQHAFLSLSTDSILAERVSIEAASPSGVPVFPVVPYGMTPSFAAYPGTVSLTMATYTCLLTNILCSLRDQGFSRMVIVNGHGGNTPARTVVTELVGKSPGLEVAWHDWWCAPMVWAKVQEIDPVASHASWMENFPWTRLEGVASPDQAKPMVDFGALRTAHPADVRDALGDGNFGGLYTRSDDDMLALWAVAVEETRQVIESV